MIDMFISSDKDFPEVRSKIREWRRRFPMFSHDISRLENIIEGKISNYSRLMVQHRQTKQRYCLDDAEKEIQSINNILAMADKMELMAILSH